MPAQFAIQGVHMSKIEEFQIRTNPNTFHTDHKSELYISPFLGIFHKKHGGTEPLSMEIQKFTKLTPLHSERPKLRSFAFVSAIGLMLCEHVPITLKF